jgi:hypothetical protein
MWLRGDGKKMEDISRCFMFFSQFRNDIDILIEKGVIKNTAFDHYEWTKSKTSLAEYFIWIGVDNDCVEGGFWAPIAKSFTVKGKPVTQSQLSNLLYKRHKLDEGKDAEHSGSDEFKNIKNMVSESRKQKEEWKVFHKNFEELLNEKHRIIHEYFELPIHERETPETIRNIVDRFDEAHKILKSGEKSLKVIP